MIYQGDAWKYIYDTPDILEGILEKEDGLLQESRRLLTGRKISEICLTGSGSSYNAAAAASAFAKKRLGIRVVPVYPSALMEDADAVPENAVVLGISQQGTSMAVIQALDVLKKRGMAVISVTGEYDTEITRHGNANLYVECGYEDAGATTKGYTATVLTLMLFFLMTAEITGQISERDADAYRKRLRKVIRNMKSVLTDSRFWCEQTAKELKTSTDLIVISGGSLRGFLQEAVLKFSETCRFPVRGYEAEEFMHGIYNSVNASTDFLYLFPAGGREVQRMMKLYEYYEKQGNRQFAVHMPVSVPETDAAGTDGSAETPDQEGQCSVRSLTCRFLDDVDFSVLEYALVQQMLFVLASRERGIDLNLPRDPEFHKYMKSKTE